MPDYTSDIDISSYLYSSTIVITNSLSQDLSGYPIKLEFTSSNFNFDLVRSDGNDIRLAERSDGKSAFYIYKRRWTSSYGELWFKIPLLLASQVKTVYIFWGNDSASDASAPDDLGFLFADRFDSDNQDPTKWTGSDNDLTTVGSPMSGIKNWQVIMRLKHMGTSIDGMTGYYCARDYFNATENPFYVSFYSEGVKHDFVDGVEERYYNESGSDSYEKLNGEGGIETNSNCDIIYDYYEPIDKLRYRIQNRDTWPDDDNAWEHKGLGNHRMTSFRHNVGTTGTDPLRIREGGIIIREYYGEGSDPSIDMSNLYTALERIDHATLATGTYGPDLTYYGYYHETDLGGEPRRLSDNGTSSVWESDEILPPAPGDDPTATWHTGTGAPSISLGEKDDYYLDESTGNVYKKDSPILSDLLSVGGTAYGSTDPEYGWDDDTDTYAAWYGGYSVRSGYYDFGFGVAHAINYIKAYGISADYYIYGQVSAVDPLELLVTSNAHTGWKIHEFNNVTEYRYIHFYTQNLEIGASIYEIQCYIYPIYGWRLLTNSIDGYVMIDFGRYNDELTSINYLHYDNGHETYFGAAKLSDSDADINNNTYWHGTTSSGIWAAIDFETSKKVGVLSLKPVSDSLTSMAKNFRFEGANSDPRFSTTDWKVLYTGQASPIDVWQTFYFTNGRPFRYYRLYVVDTYGDDIKIQEWRMHEFIESPIQLTQKTISRIVLKPPSEYLYFPKTVEIQASNGDGWTTLVSGTNTYTPSDLRWQEYAFANSTAYWMYKLVLSNNWGNTNEKLSIAEWTMHEEI